MKAILRVCFGLLCWGLLPSAAVAQTTGAIRGTVKDSSGAVVVGANITLTLLGTQNLRLATAGSDGTFEVAELPVGHYSVEIGATGFKKFVLKDVEVAIGHVAVISATLEVGTVTETVVVEAAAAQVETTSTQLGAVMTDVSVRQLPLSTRDTYQLLQLQPGVQSQLGADLFYGSDQAGVVSVNGGRGRSNNYMVNGGDGNDIFVNLPAIQPSPDAIDEFRVLTNTFDAEYGRNSGSVVNVVTKSGTNDFHGDVFEFFRNKVLNTRNYFFSKVPDYKQNQFGGTFGGRIKKDKTFFFVSYEGNRLRQGVASGTGFVNLPTAAEAGGNFSEVASGATGVPFTGTLTDANFASILAGRSGGTCNTDIMAGQTAGSLPAIGAVAGTPYTAVFPNNIIPMSCFDPTALDLYNQFVGPFGTGRVNFFPDRQLRDDQVTFHFDHKISAAQQFSAYYYFDDLHRVDPYSFFQAAGANLPGFGAIFDTRVQQWNLSHTWVIGSTAVNEFRFNYFREGQGRLDHPIRINDVHASCKTVPASMCFTDPTNPQLGITTALPGREGVPFVSVSGGFAVGDNFEGELPQVGNTFQWTDNYSRVIGKHSLKFGGDVRRQRFDQFLYFEISGSYAFLTNPASPVSNDTGGPNAYANYFLGAPNSYAQGAAQGEDLRNTSLYLFAQDSWKLKPSVTLNYGLRWELNTPYYDLGNRLQTFRPGQITAQYPCVLNPSNPVSAGLIATYGSTDCSPTGPANAVFPVGLVFPGDKGVQRGLTQTYYHAFAPRIGLAWSPGWNNGVIAKLTGGPEKSSIRMGWGLFYNPMEQLVLEQFSAEPPFGGSAFFSNPLFNLPFEPQAGGANPNPFTGIINQTPKTPCFQAGGPSGCVDWSRFRPMLLFGEFQPHLRAQYSVQYNLTLERQLAKDIILRVGYVGTQAHRLLSSHELNPGNAATCLAIAMIPGQSCGPFGSDSFYSIAANSIPAGVTLPLPYGSVPSVSGPNNPAITLVGLRPYSSPLCQPTTGVGCPADGTPVFSNIFAEDTIGNSNYNGLQVQLEKHFSKGLYLSVAYTYSKAIDQGATFENELNPFNFRKSRGLSLIDARHRFVFSPYWEFPVPKYSGFKGKLLDGWGVSAIITYQSGFPIRFVDGDDTELNSSFFFEVANTPQITGKLQFVNPKSPSTANMWFNTSNISDPPLGTFGSSPHALCCGPAISNSDISIQKRTPITERVTAEFRAEFFNAWNHTQFANPDGNFTDSTFGLIQKTREDPRVIQFGLKLIF